MNDVDSLKVLDILIDFFEAGNSLTDSAAKLILKEDGEYEDYWSRVIKQFGSSVDWTGIRAPEAEFLSLQLRLIKEQLESKVE